MMINAGGAVLISVTFFLRNFLIGTRPWLLFNNATKHLASLLIVQRALVGPYEGCKIWVG